ncbi:MAG: hypothetical protein EOO42_18200 [Flavobacteriales bacterium]|nr:MAG: hypothetical protein EOO42_18200 [Flavobacteriales bacterium]
MKKILFNYIITIVAFAALFSGCRKDSDYVNSTPSSFISNFDLRKLYKGTDLNLNPELLRGASLIRGQVVSDHSGNNLPTGLLIVQNVRMVGNGIDSLRGIAINIGNDAAKYVPGDSVHIQLEGGVLKRVNGILQITGLSNLNITKVASGTFLKVNRGFANLIVASPEAFESTLVTIVKATYNPTLAATDAIVGDKKLNDGTADITLNVQPSAVFANLIPPYSGNYTGILFNIQNNGISTIQHRPRTRADIVTLSSEIEKTPAVISGFMADPNGGDPRYEYVQLLATQDINFALTPFSVIVSNNAGNAVPGGFPTNGWATGGVVNVAQNRTYQLSLTTGIVKKGEFFYVGGDLKFINGNNSTSMASSKWIRSFNYTTTDGDDGVGVKTGTTGLMANSGNSWGIALFNTRKVTKDTRPIDAVFTSTGGSVYSAGSPAIGYRIPNNDFYDSVDPITLQEQPFWRSGTNNQHLGTHPTADLGYFNLLGGVYSATLGKWVQARTRTLVQLTKQSPVTEIETGIRGVEPTSIK